MASLLVAALTLVAAGAAWGGLGWLLTNVPPSRPLAVLAAYVFAFAAITSSGALVAWLALRPRSEDAQLRSPAGYLAHSMLLATILLFGMWLQTLRTLTPIVVVLLIGLYAILELGVLFGTRGSVELPVQQ
jgi:ABC-type proline/glycine betaine transport system permease subunit